MTISLNIMLKKTTEQHLIVCAVVNLKANY